MKPSWRSFNQNYSIVLISIPGARHVRAGLPTAPRNGYACCTRITAHTSEEAKQKKMAPRPAYRNEFLVLTLISICVPACGRLPIFHPASFIHYRASLFFLVSVALIALAGCRFARVSLGSGCSVCSGRKLVCAESSRYAAL